MPLKKIRSFIVVFLLLIFLFLSILLYANYLIQNPSVQARFIERLSQDTGLNIKTEKIELSLRQGIGINVTGFEASSKNGDTFMSAADVIINIVARELLRGHIVPTRIYFLKPKIALLLEKNDSINNSESIQAINKIPFFWIPNLYSLRVEKGQLNIINKDYGISELSLNILKKGSLSLALILNSMGKLEIEGEKIPFRLKGIITPSSEEGFLSSTDLIIETEKAPLNILPLSGSFFFKQGSFNTRLNIQSGPEGIIQTDGHITMSSVNYGIIRNDQQKDFYIPEVSLDFSSNIKGKKLDFPRVTLKSDDLSLSSSFNLDFENMKNPYLKLSVKSGVIPVEVFKNIFPSPLMPSWVENRLLSALTQGDVKLQLFELNGSNQEILHLSLPQNNSTIRLELECNRLLFSGTEFEKPIQIVSSKISLENGEFRISDIEAKLDNSRIRLADFLMKDVFNSSAYEFSMNGIFNLEEIFHYRGTPFVPKSLRARLEEVDQISGNLDCKTTVVFEEGWEFPKILKGDFHFIDCQIQHKQFHIPLLIKGGVVHVDEDGMDEFNAQGSFGLSDFSLSGSFRIADNHIQLYKADISAEADMNQLLPLVIGPERFHLIFNKTLRCHVSVINERDYFSFIGNVDMGGILLKTDEYSISPNGEKDNFIFDINYRKGEWIELKKSIARFGNSFIRISGIHNINPSVPTTINISSPNISLEEFDIRPKGKSARIKGNISCDLKINLLNAAKKDLLLTGTLQGEHIYIETKRLSSPLREMDFRFELDGNKLKINTFNTKIGKSDISIIGSLSGWNGLKGILTIDSNYIDTLDLTMGKGPNSDEVTDSKDSLAKKLDIFAYIKIKKGRWKDMIIGPSTASIRMEDGNIKIIDSLLNLEHGTAEIMGFLQRSENPNIAFSGDIRLFEQPMDKILTTFNLPKDKIEGNVTMNAKLSVSAEKKEDLLPSISGRADITLTDGFINNSRVLLKVLDFLSLKNIFRKKKPGFMDEGFYFDSINATTEIMHGIINSDNFIMKSPVFNAVAYGKADLVEKTVDFTLGVQPYGSIDTLVSSIPLLGEIITGDKKSIIAYPFLVKGPISDPDVKFTPLKGLGEGVGGIFMRLFMTPTRIFNDLQKGISGEKKDNPSGADP